MAGLIPITTGAALVETKPPDFVELSALAFALALPWSIAASQISLTLVFIGLMARPRPPTITHGATLATLGFVAWSLLASVLATQPWVALRDSKDLLLLSIVVLIPAAVASRPGLRTRLPLFFVASGGLSAAFGGFQFVRDGSDLLHRARGPFGHYMAFAGVTMLVGVAAVAMAMCGRGKPRQLAVLSLLPTVVGLEASLTRSSWLGFAAATIVMVAAVRPRLLVAVAGALVVLALVAPKSVGDRVGTIFDRSANLDRVEMFRIGLKMIQDRPWFGVGPGNLPAVYLEYHPTRPQPHLHSNPMQLAAERGIPGVLLWLCILIGLLRSAVINRRLSTHDTTPILGYGAVAGFVVAGMFEYNFGDSEVKMAFLFLAALASAPLHSAGKTP